MSNFESSPLGRLDASGHLLSPVFKGATTAGRFGFRGELALKFPATVAGEKRPPEIKSDQVFALCEGDALQLFAGHVHSLEHLALLRELLGDALRPGGGYFVWAANVDLLKKYHITLDGIGFHVLPLDEGTVYNELLDVLGLEKGDLKKLSMEEKLEAITAAAADFSDPFPETAFDAAVAEMGPVKVTENRPV